MKDIRNSRQFYYTQHSLSAFESCPMKFRKRYMEGLRWDSRPDEESKAAIEKGNKFHLMAQRYFMGIDTGLTENVKDFEILNKWICNLMEFFEIRREAAYFPEYTLRTDAYGLQLEANFDLIVAEERKVTIWDWKTHNYSARESSNKLENSLQTMVYLFTLGGQVTAVTGKAARPVELSMKYWQPDPPRVITEIKYDDAACDKFRIALQNIVRVIKEYDYTEFDKSLYSGNCRHCEFVWYCNGNLD